MNLLAHSPRFTTADAERIARDLCGVDGSASPLTSERDQNFLLRTGRDESFVLKIANAREDPAFLEAQRWAMERVAARASLCPRVLPLKSGNWVDEVPSPDGQRHFVRLLTFIP